ncbi:MAG: LAO/AO transport system kinase [Myxococcales bacterium]
MRTRDPLALVEPILAGDVRSGARLMRLLDDRSAGATEALKRLYPHTGRAFVLGLTGNPGSGKSTLVNQLVRHYRSEGLRVGVVAVDPSSPFSGGAILGDRIRMVDHFTDPGVFIRSLATRGALGGLSRSTHDVVSVLDAMGYDAIIVETVGVGQDEIDIVRLADTCVVVVVPGLGDDIQAIKAGILEIADIFVVNKADHDGADRVLRDLRQMQAMMSEMPPWFPPIVKAVAVRGEGIADVAEKIAEHRAFLTTDAGTRGRRRLRERHVLDQVLRDLAVRAIDGWLATDGRRDTYIDQIIARETDPYSVGDEVLGALLRTP